MTSKIVGLSLATAAAGLLAIPALAAEPASGTISNASPAVEWTGESAAYGTYTVQNATFEDAPCEAPSCDVFTLDVADQGDVTISVDNTAGTGPGCDCMSVTIVKPDGSMQLAEATDQPVQVKLKNAPKGSYELRIRNNNTPQDPSYKGSAKLGAAPAAVTPPPSSGPPTPPSSQPPASQPAASLALKTRKASAKKSRKGLKLVVTSTKPVTNVTAQLMKGKKVVAKGALAKIDKQGTIKLKVKKLKKGSYTVVLRAKDGANDVAATAKLKLTR